MAIAINVADEFKLIGPEYSRPVLDEGGVPFNVYRISDPSKVDCNVIT